MLVSSAPLVVGGRYTADTAPDAISRAILSRTLTSFSAGAPAGAVDLTPTIKSNFPQLIEQNFASMDGLLASVIIQGLSNAELAGLAQRYNYRVSANRQTPQLLNVLASRLQTSQLRRISQHFGAAAVANAVAASSSPMTRAAFQSASRIAVQAPPLVKTQDGPAVFMDMTITDLYLYFRVSPAIGLLSIEASLAATAMAAYALGSASWNLGWGFGSGIANLMQNYTPGLWEAIGNGIGAIVDGFLGLFQSTSSSTGTPDTTAARGAADVSTATAFGTTQADDDFFSSTGGALGEANDWRDWTLAGGWTYGGTYGGGGGGGHPSPDPVME